MVTLQQHWIEQGIEQGIDRGRVQTVNEMLAMAYPEYSAVGDPLSGIPPEILQRLMKAAISGASWGEIQKLIAPKQS